MKLRDLQDRLRAHIRARIDGGLLTGSHLARQVGIQQGHLSNFLNSRRGLSLELMDRLLEVLQMGVLDLEDSAEIQRQTLWPAVAAGFEGIVVVSAEHAAQLARFTPGQVRETLNFKKAYLRKLKPDDVCQRSHWLRFVAVKLGPKTVRAVFPRAAERATLLIDRHYTSLDPYHKQQPNLYAVYLPFRFAIGQLSLAGDRLVLRPEDPLLPVELARIDRTKGYSNYIVGRVCHVAIEI
jgi:transcriptional regulator with XRE-family HTH domain